MAQTLFTVENIWQGNSKKSLGIPLAIKQDLVMLNLDLFVCYLLKIAVKQTGDDGDMLIFFFYNRNINCYLS